MLSILILLYIKYKKYIPITYINYSERGAVVVMKL